MKTLKFVFLLFLGCLVCAGCLYAEKVKYVIDGDTVVLDDDQKIRLIGINAPEVDHPKYEKKGEPFGPESKDYLKALIEGKEVILKKGPEAFDRFGRRLAYVYLSDGTFVNREMVRLGYAETFRKFSFEYKEEFFELEREARKNKLGMWGSRRSPWTDEASKWVRKYFLGKTKSPL